MNENRGVAAHTGNGSTMNESRTAPWMFLGPRSSWCYWRTRGCNRKFATADERYALGALPAPYPKGNSDIQHFVPTRLTSESRRAIESRLLPNSPVDALVVSKGMRRKLQGLPCTLIAHDLPKDSFFIDEAGFAVCAPQLVFLLMAANGAISLPELVCKGMELCGGYAVVDPRRLAGENAKRSIVGRDQLVNKADLLSYLDSLEQIVASRRRPQGIVRAYEAAKFLLDNSASPMESVLVSLLCLPARHGGFGLLQPKLNEEIAHVARSDGSTQTLRGDLVWRQARLIVEYDSDEYHANIDSLHNDSSRRLSLETHGYSVLTATKRSVYNRGETAQLAGSIARKLDHRLRTTIADYERRQEILRDQLLYRRSHDDSHSQGGS